MNKSLGVLEVLAGLGLLASTVAGFSARAAPFCLQNQAVPPQCIYYDANSCRRDAARQGAWCIVNPDAVGTAQPGGGSYCMVTSGGVSVCNFSDGVSCAREAAHEGGACVAAPTPPVVNTPNPYQYLQPAPGEQGPAGQQAAPE